MLLGKDDSYKVNAKRGHIYLFEDANAQWKEKYVLVVSDDTRQTDKIVSIVVLGDNNRGVDVVAVDIPNVGTKYAHTGMITYIGRYKLSKDLGQVSKKKMDLIDTHILRHYGLADAKTCAEHSMYKNAYEELLEKVLKKESE